MAFPLSRGKPRRGRLSGRAIGPPVGSLAALSRKGRHHVAADPTGRERRPAPACPPPPSVIDAPPGRGDGGTIHPVQTPVDKGVARWGVSYWGDCGIGVDRDVDSTRGAPQVAASFRRKSGSSARGEPVAGALGPVGDGRAPPMRVVRPEPWVPTFVGMTAGGWGKVPGQQKARSISQSTWPGLTRPSSRPPRAAGLRWIPWASSGNRWKGRRRHMFRTCNSAPIERQNSAAFAAHKRQMCLKLMASFSEKR
jgi:hypothetical protein